jgi:iron complex transport system ATP-binding protein
VTTISLRDVGVAYNGNSVLNGVSLSVADGEWMGLIGPNGAGKTTLLRAVVGAVPFSGLVSVGDASVGSADIRSMARQVAYVPQRPVFPDGMSVFDFVMLGRTPHLGPLAAERSKDIAIVWDALESLSLTAFSDRNVGSLSGGETQRASLARVLAQEPRVVVLDEATASLDVAAQHEVLELIAEIREQNGITILSAIHDLTASAQFCDRVTLLDRGAVAASGTPEEVLTEATLGAVFDPTIRVIDVEGSLVVVSLRTEGTIDD